DVAERRNTRAYPYGAIVLFSPHFDLGQSAACFSSVSKHYADFGSLDTREGDGVARATGRFFRGFLLTGHLLPGRAVPELHDVLFGRLDTATIVVHVQLDAADFLLRAEVDFQPIGRVRRLVAGPPVSRGGAKHDSAVVYHFYFIESRREGSRG